MNNRNRRGIVLLFVLGLLALMSVLAMSFVSMSRLERSISRNYVDRTHALLAAESGVEYALARLREMDGIVDPEDLEAMKWDATTASFAMTSDPAWSGGVDASNAGNARFRLRVDDDSGKINLNDTDGSWNMDHDPIPDDPDTDPDLLAAPGRLRMIVKHLGDALFGAPLGLQIANTLLDARAALPGERFSDLRQVEDLLTTGPAPVLDADQYKQFVAQVTLWSWQDHTTLRPNFQLAIESPNPAWSWPNKGLDVYIYRDFQTKGFDFEPRCPVNVNAAGVETLEALLTDVRGWFLREGPGERVSNGRYGSYGQSTPRFDYTDESMSGHDNYPGFPGIGAPDISSAITAGSNTPPGLSSTARVCCGFPYGKNQIFGKASQTLPLPEPGLLANAIWERVHGKDLDGDGQPAPGAQPNPFTTWEEFEDYLRNDANPNWFIPPDDYATYFNDAAEGRGTLTGSGFLSLPGVGSDTFGFAANPGRRAWWINYIRQTQVDALIANFNPNAAMQDYSSNRVRFRSVDKAHLTQYTTELCFQPGGVFHVSSQGAALDVSGATLAATEIHAIVQLWDLLRITTQEQFMRDVDSHSDLANVFTECTSQSLAGDNPSAGEAGYTLQSYPEPVRAGLTQQFSPYDGCLMLATKQNEPPGANFFHHYNGSLQPALADCPAGLDALFTTGAATDPVMMRNTPTSDRLTHSAASPGLPGVLFPDGGLSDTGRTLTIPTNNVGSDFGCKGTLAFWIKPNYHTGISTRPRKLVTMHSQTLGPLTSLDTTFPQVHLREFTVYYMCHDYNLKPADWVTINWLKNDQDADAWAAAAGLPVPTGFSWIATRSFVGGFGGLRNDSGVPLFTYPPRNVWALGTETACHDFPPLTMADTDPDAIHFEGHAWNTFAFAWNTDALWDGSFPFLGTTPINTPNPLDKFQMCINGELVTDRYAGGNNRAATNIDDGFHGDDTRYPLWNRGGINDHIRFGEVTGGGADFGKKECFSADAVFDEIVGFPTKDLTQAQGIFAEGRYYNGDSGESVYRSPEIDVVAALGSTDKTEFQISGLYWTAYWPRANREGKRLAANLQGEDVNTTATDPMDARWNAGLAAGEGWDPISIDLSVAPTGVEDWKILDSMGSLVSAKSAMPAQAGGSRVSEAFAAAGLSDAVHARIDKSLRLRFRVYFNYEDSGTQAIYESPVFDDITFVLSYRKPKILHWQMGAES